MSALTPCLASECIMPTWIAPKLPPPASTRAVVARPECSGIAKAVTSPRSGASQRAPLGELIAAAQREVLPSQRHPGRASPRAASRDLINDNSALDEGLLDHEMAGLVVGAFAKAARLEHLLQLFQHRGAAAHHDAVGRDVERLLADIVEELFGSDQVGDAAAVAERLAGDSRIIDKLVGEQRSEQLVVAQLRHQLLAIGEFGHLPAAMHQHDAVEAIIDVGVLD